LLIEATLSHTIFLTLLLVIITSVYAFLTFRILQSNRAAVAAMNSQVESATRPYVVVSLRRERGGYYSFVVSNAGHSAARGLRLTSNPEIKPVSATGDFAEFGKPPDATNLFKNPITYLPPSQALAALFGHYSGIKAAYPGLSFKITLHYEGSSRSYDEKLELSLKPTDETQHVADFDLGEELHKIRETLEKLSSKPGS
jgi:hypothetical protein